MERRLSLPAKIRLVIAFVRTKEEGKGLTRLRVGASAVFLALAPLALVVAGLAAEARSYLYAAHFILLAMLFVVFWELSWRLAVDQPMGDAWFNVSGARRLMIGLYGACVVADIVAQDWRQVPVDLGIIYFLWPRGGGGGGGWDDEDIPAPQPRGGAEV